MRAILIVIVRSIRALLARIAVWRIGAGRHGTLVKDLVVGVEDTESTALRLVDEKGALVDAESGFWAIGARHVLTVADRVGVRGGVGGRGEGESEDRGDDDEEEGEKEMKGVHFVESELRV